jgi:hypothetical protein
MADVAYVGSLGRHVLQTRNLNALPYGTRFLPSSIDPTTGSSLPEAFLRRYRGYLDILQTEFDGSAGRTHTLVVNYSYDLPSVRQVWNNAVARAVLDNWQVSGSRARRPARRSASPAALKESRTSPAAEAWESIPARITSAIQTSRRAIGLPRAPLRPSASSRRRSPPIGSALEDPTRSSVPGTSIGTSPSRSGFRSTARARCSSAASCTNAINTVQFSNVNNSAEFDRAGNQVNGEFGQYTDGARRAAHSVDGESAVLAVRAIVPLVGPRR